MLLFLLDDIHRQALQFTAGATPLNRSTSPWSDQGNVLPSGQIDAAKSVFAFPSVHNVASPQGDQIAFVDRGGWRGRARLLESRQSPVQGPNSDAAN